MCVMFVALLTMSLGLLMLTCVMLVLLSMLSLGLLVLVCVLFLFALDVVARSPNPDVCHVSVRC